MPETNRNTHISGINRKSATRQTGVASETRASIAVVGAAVIAVLVGMAAIAVDLGTGYLSKVANQRAADSIAYAGALAYNASGSTTMMQSAVSNLAVLNGLAAGAVTASLVASPRGDGNSAVQATVSTTAPLYLATVFQSATTLSVSATSYAEVKPGASTCILALQAGGTGLTLSGGTAVTATKCTVASDATVTVPCGTTITTPTLDYNSAAVPSQPCTGIVPPTGTASVSIVKAATANPLSGNGSLSGAFSHLATVAAQTGPAGPVISPGASIAFSSSLAPTQTQLAAIGCTGKLAGSTWTVTCPVGGPYPFGTISLSGGITLNFAVGGPSTNKYNFSGAIDFSSGAGGSFGPGTYNVAGGIVTGGGSITSFGPGTYNIGAGTVKCAKKYFSICNTGNSLTFGAGTYTIAGGIYNAGGETLTIGAGSSANSFNVGAGSNGDAIDALGTTTTLGDMTNGTFRAVGAIVSGGGTTLNLGAAPAHDLNGAVTLAGNATLGAGVYTVAGNVGFGSGGGGGFVTGSGVSVIVSGTFTVTAGYNTVTLTAPTSGTMQNVVVAGNGAGGATFSAGASGNSLSGVVYFPSGPISLSGAGNVGNGAGQCLELIGSSITLMGGSALATTCSGMGGVASGGTVVLVQ